MKKIKVSDYIIQLLQQKGVDTGYCIAGGAAAHLMESTRVSDIRVIHNYNEQACAMAAEGYARMAKKPALVLVTNGPGSSNLITGVLGAWQDSIPMFVISGQVPRHQTLSAEPLPLRQLGLQEANIISMVQYCTNYAVQLTDASRIKYEVDRAWYLATTGRMGPVWLDIPIDLQAEFIDPDLQAEYLPEVIYLRGHHDMTDINTVISRAQRPLIIAGNGIHLADAEVEFRQLVDRLQIPVICTWNATDLFSFEDPLYVGNFGLLGERAANFAVQRADLLLILGSRLSIPCIGYNSQDFAPDAVKIMVDIDHNEIIKHTIKIHYPCAGDVKDIMPSIQAQVDCSHWTQLLMDWKYRFPVFGEDHVRDADYVNSFDFMEHLGTCLRANDVVVTDMGTSFTCTMQSLRNTGHNRLFTSSALCSMGYGLPGAIGAQVASPGSRVICIAGDGGFQMNIQELQTVVQYNLPIKIILLDNAGYLAISLMQDNLFDKQHFGADAASGVGSPDFCAVANAYGIPSHRLDTLEQVLEQLADLLAQPGPALIEINMVRNQLLIPRVQSRRDQNGNITSGSLDSMFPYLSEAELLAAGIR